MPDPLEPFSEETKSGKKVDDLAAEIMNDHLFLTDASKGVYRYERGPWLPVPEVLLWKLAMDYDDGPGTHHRRNEVVRHIQAKTFREDHKWGRVWPYQVPLENGILDVRSRDMGPHQPDYYLERVVPYAYDARATCPVWDQCLIDWFGETNEDDGRAEALQEFFGYILMPHATYKKALFLYGDPDCGKSVIVQVAKALVGDLNSCSLPVEHMDDPVKRSIIKGKALNVITELPSRALIADAGFKTLVSTEEPILLDPKYRDPETYTPTAKHVIASNFLPVMSERTEAGVARLLIIPMPASIPQHRQDRELPSKLRAEMAGILLWAVEGARRLYERGGEFETPFATELMLDEYRDEINPIKQFLREMCIEDVRGATPLSVLADRFNRWSHVSKRASTRDLGVMLREARLGHLIGQVRVPPEHKNAKCLKGYVLSRTEPSDAYTFIDRDLGEEARSGWPPMESGEGDNDL